MKNIVIGFFLLTLSGLNGFAQFFSLVDIETGLNTYLEPADLKNLQWLGNSDRYIFSDDTCLFTSELNNNQVVKVLDLKTLNKALSLHGNPLNLKFPEVKVVTNSTIAIQSKMSMLVFDIIDNRSFSFVFPDSAENFSLSPDGCHLAYTLGSNLYLQDSLNRVVQITYDSIDGMTNGDIVMRNEFGLTESLFWSPKGNYLAYYHKNETFVSTYPQVDIRGPQVKFPELRYPFAGAKSEETDVMIYSPETGKTLKLNIKGDKEQYHTNLSWTPDESAVYIQHLNRGQDTMVLKSYHTLSGELNEILFTETHKKYVEPENPVVFSRLKPGSFFYQSARSGYNHIYYFNSVTGKLSALTSGAWDVTKFIGFSEDENYVYFTATKQSYLENHPYKVNINTGEITCLASDAGTHEVILNSRGSYFFDEYSNKSTPRHIQLVSGEGEKVRDLLQAPLPFKDKLLGDEISGTILAADDSTELYYTLVKPVNFKKSKKYPVVVYLYGGPHVQLNTNAWLGKLDYFRQYMAQRGIATFVLDTRGSDNRGRGFEDCIFRQTGIPQQEDQMRGIAFLKSLPYIDTERIGIHGWSYGGFMTLSMMLNYPDVFSVGVAGGPVTDWKNYEVMYGERYMDTPAENPEGYVHTSVLNRVQKLQGKLLIIHGGVDNVVLPMHSLLFLNEGIKYGKNIDFFVYPTHEHNIKGKDRVHLTRMITDYFLENL